MAEHLLFNEKYVLAYFCVPIKSRFLSPITLTEIETKTQIQTENLPDKNDQALVECKVIFGFLTDSCINIVVKSINHINVKCDEQGNINYTTINQLYSANENSIIVGERCDKQNDIVYYKTPIEAIIGHCEVVHTCNGQLAAVNIFFPYETNCVKYTKSQQKSCDYSTNFSNIFEKMTYIETFYILGKIQKSIVYLPVQTSTQQTQQIQEEKIIGLYQDGQLVETTYMKNNTVIHQTIFENNKVIKYSEYRDDKLYKEMGICNGDVIVVLQIDGIEQKFINNIKS